MQSILSSLATIALSLIVSMGLLPASVPQKTVGSAVPSTPALVDTYLAANMSAADTSMTLANGTTNDGTALSGYMCFTIDANMPTVEYVCGTASSTSVTGLTRGIDLTNPNATTTRVYAHRRFASVQTTDYPTLQFIVRKLNGVDTFDSVLSYTSTTPSNFTSSQDLASKGYVDNQIVSGGVPITTSTPGIGLLASSAQTAAGTATGTYNSQTYNLLPANSSFNQTSSASNIVPVTGSNGKLSDGFIDHTASYTNGGNINYTGSQTYSSSTTFNASSTVTFQGSVAGVNKFGGTGADGALSISSGTTTLDLGGVSVFTKNYTSISITGTGSLGFSNPNASGTIIILKSQGNVVLTSSAVPNINASGIGALGGSGGATSGANGSVGSIQNYLYFGGNTNGLAGLAATSTNVSGGSSVIYPMVYAQKITKSLFIAPGAGGAGGAAGTTGGVGAFGPGGTGGRGGGGLYIECGGYLNYTGTISVAGGNGANGTAGTGGTGAGGSGGGGGGGGGAGGIAVVLYNFLTTNTGTTIYSGGAGGTGGNGGTGTVSSGSWGGSGGSGAGGMENYIGGNGGGADQNNISVSNGGASGTAGSNSNGGNGGNASNDGSGFMGGGGGGGGGGASGKILISQNTEF